MIDLGYELINNLFFATFSFQLQKRKAVYNVQDVGKPSQALHNEEEREGKFCVRSPGGGQGQLQVEAVAVHRHRHQSFPAQGHRVHCVQQLRVSFR